MIPIGLLSLLVVTIAIERADRIAPGSRVARALVHQLGRLADTQGIVRSARSLSGLPAISICGGQRGARDAAQSGPPA